MIIEPRPLSSLTSSLVATDKEEKAVQATDKVKT
jgi:hypothetical protein